MGIVPNRSGSPQGVLQALWRNLFRSNPFHFGSADETELVWLADARSVRDPPGQDSACRSRGLPVARQNRKRSEHQRKLPRVSVASTTTRPIMSRAGLRFIERHDLWIP